MGFLSGLQQIYGDLDKKVAGGWLPGGAARDRTATEAALNLAGQLPTSRLFGNGVRAAGAIAPETFGPTVDAAENAWRAVSGDKTARPVSEFNPVTQERLADGIDNALAEANPKVDKDGYTAVSYRHYNKDGGEHKNPIAYVTGSMWAKRNDDGTYKIKDNENYDFNAGGNKSNPEYKSNLDDTFMAAVKRGDLIAAGSAMPDYLSWYTGAGTEGFNIGGTFSRPSKDISSGPSPELPIDTPAPSMSGSYQVKSGDTLTAIANQLGTSVQDLAKKNSINDVNNINVGMNLSY